MRTDLPSMNSGKAMAQASHASNAFVHDVTKTFTKHNKLQGPLQRAVEEWQSETTQGFGTVIVLSVNKKQLTDVFETPSLSESMLSNVITDPTYPYIVNNEIAALIDPKLHTVDPIPKNDGTTVLHRKETTCGYIFGTKEDCKPVIGHLSLHP